MDMNQPEKEGYMSKLKNKVELNSHLVRNHLIPEPRDYYKQQVGEIYL